MPSLFEALMTIDYRAFSVGYLDTKNKLQDLSFGPQESLAWMKQKLQHSPIAEAFGVLGALAELDTQMIERRNLEQGAVILSPTSDFNYTKKSFNAFLETSPTEAEQAEALYCIRHFMSLGSNPEMVDQKHISFDLRKTFINSFAAADFFTDKLRALMINTLSTTAAFNPAPQTDPFVTLLDDAEHAIKHISGFDHFSQNALLSCLEAFELDRETPRVNPSLENTVKSRLSL